MLRPGIWLAPLPDGTFYDRACVRRIASPHVGYDYMNSRLVHDRTCTGCSDSLMGCTQDEQDSEMEEQELTVILSCKSCSSCPKCLFLVAACRAVLFRVLSCSFVASSIQ